MIWSKKMFKIEIDNKIHLELVHPSHAKRTFALANKECI